MTISKFILTLFLTIISFLSLVKNISAATLAEQTTDYSGQINSHRIIQELGDNLSGSLGSITFRVFTSLPNSQMFDFTAQNTRIYDKSIGNNIVATGCASGNSSDRLRGLLFTTQGVPTGYENVTIDFSCNNFTFIPGRRYLISIGNAGTTFFSGRIQFAAASYAGKTVDYFSGGGLRYSIDKTACSPTLYIWNSPAMIVECYIWTTPKDDLYFILKDNQPPTPSKTPLILIPGIGGSELRVAEDTNWSAPDGHGGIYTHVYAKGEKVWVNEGEAAKPGHDDYFDILRMKPDGEIPEANLELTGNLFEGAYQPTIDFFVSNGYELNKTLFVFPYDWRKDIILTAPLLDQKITDIKSQTGSQKVDILSHSMGGLVARYYISDPNRAVNVRKLLLLGTPHLGSVKFLKYFHYGGCFIYEVGPFCLSIAPTELKDVLQNLIGGFELSPSIKYFEFYSNEDRQHPYPFFTEFGALNYNQIKDFLLNAGYNVLLFSPTESFHTIDTNLSNINNAEITIIAGSGLNTIGQVIEKPLISLIGVKSTYKDILNINGDNTVPLFSASLNDSSKNKSLLGSAKIYYTKQNHGDLPKDISTLSLVRNILSDDTSLPSGISTIPLQLSGNLFSIHSPINIHIYDSSGNHTGSTSDGDFEINIPGSSYETIEDAKFIFLLDNGVYTVKFEATNKGSFDFKIRKYENDINTTSILYEDIPLTISTKGHATFDTNNPKGTVLQVDKDGDGSTDFSVTQTSILTGNDVNDSTPPITIISLSGEKDNNDAYKNEVKVTLSATDPGSGLLKTEYTIDNGATIQNYSDPFTINTLGKKQLKFRSIDKTGNEENPQTVEIEIISSGSSSSGSGNNSNGSNDSSTSATNQTIASVLGTAFQRQTDIGKLIRDKVPDLQDSSQNKEIISTKSSIINPYTLLGGIVVFVTLGLIAKSINLYSKLSELLSRLPKVR